LNNRSGLASAGQFVFLAFRDDLFLDVRRSLTVGRQFHRERSLTLSHAAKVGCVTESFRQRNFRQDDGHAFVGIVAGHQTTTTNDVTGDGTLEVFWHFDFDLHDRFEQLRSGLLEVLAEATLSSRVEGFFARVNVVVATVEQLDASSHNGVVSDWALAQDIAEAFFNSGDVLLRNTTTNNLFFELEAVFAFRFDRDQLANDVSVLT